MPCLINCNRPSLSITVSKVAFVTTNKEDVLYNSCSCLVAIFVKVVFALDLDVEFFRLAVVYNLLQFLFLSELPILSF